MTGPIEYLPSSLIAVAVLLILPKLAERKHSGSASEIRRSISGTTSQGISFHGSVGTGKYVYEPEDPVKMEKGYLASWLRTLVLLIHFGFYLGEQYESWFKSDIILVWGGAVVLIIVCQIIAFILGKFPLLRAAAVSMFKSWWIGFLVHIGMLLFVFGRIDILDPIATFLGGLA